MPVVFVYGVPLAERAARGAGAAGSSVPPGAGSAGWYAGCLARPASARGFLWERQGRPGLLHTPNAPHLEGVLVEVPAERMALLDVLERGNGLARRTITVRVEGMGVDAESWVLEGTPPRGSGWRPLKAPDWRAWAAAPAHARPPRPR